jgi:hypothetical protein
VSFAWDPFKDGKTSVRFGAGKFIDALASQVWGGQHYTPPLFEIVSEATNLAAPLNQPLYSFGASGQDPYNFARPAGLNGAIGLDAHNGSPLAAANIVWDDESLKEPYTISYFLGVQRSLTKTLTLEVNYVGNMGRHLFAQWDQNRYNDSILTNNGVVGHLNRSFGTINYSCACFNSSYNSGNVLLRQRTSRGLFVQAAYTYGHAIDQADTFGGGLGIIDAWNTRNEKGNESYDVVQKLAFSVVYLIPTPHLSPAFLNYRLIAAQHHHGASNRHKVFSYVKQPVHSGPQFRRDNCWKLGLRLQRRWKYKRPAQRACVYRQPDRYVSE